MGAAPTQVACERFLDLITVGFGVRSSSARADITIPGVQ